MLNTGHVIGMDLIGQIISFWKIIRANRKLLGKLSKKLAITVFPTKLYPKI